MTPLDEMPSPGADEPMDDLDAAILGALRGLYAGADPMPAELVDRAQFALALEDLDDLADIEVFRLAERHAEPAGARGAPSEQTQTITFDSESLTVMFTVAADGPDTVRLDGWLAPPARAEVELRLEGGTRTTTADSDGRFSLDEVPRGLAQLVVHGPADNPRAVVTPSVVL